MKSFLCTFFIFTIILLSITLLINGDYLDFSAKSTHDGIDLTFFGNTFFVDADILSSADNLLEFNDLIFGKNFSKNLKKATEHAFIPVRDAAILSYNCAKMIVGAG